MADNQWAPEPIDESTFDNDAWDTTLERCVIDKPTLRRIIATYNACAGVPVEELERWGIWMNKYQEVCPDCQGDRTRVATLGLEVGGKREYFTQFHILCDKCDGFGRVAKEPPNAT